VTPRFTLNLGLRYDLMRVPYNQSATGKNWTPGFLGGNAAIFGYSGRSTDSWMSGGGPQKGDLTQVVLVGKGTPYPKQGIWPADKKQLCACCRLCLVAGLVGKGQDYCPRWISNRLSIAGPGPGRIDGDIGKDTPDSFLNHRTLETAHSEISRTWSSRFRE